MLPLDSNKHFKSTHTSGRLKFVCLKFVNKGKFWLKVNTCGKKGCDKRKFHVQPKNILIGYLFIVMPCTYSMQWVDCSYWICLEQDEARLRSLCSFMTEHWPRSSPLET